MLSSRDEDMVSSSLLHKNDKHKEILLIYSRETDAFKEVVINFKKILTAAYGSGIHDIYELDEKCVNPQQWIADKFCNDGVKIILFLNISASVLAKHNFQLNLTNPHAFDNLFPYSLQLLRSDPNRTYHNLYVVSVSTVSTDCVQFQFLNSLTRYVFPQHTDQFLNDLYMCNHNVNKYLIETFKSSCEQYLREVRDTFKNEINTV